MSLDFGLPPFLVKRDPNIYFWATVFRTTVKFVTRIDINFPIEEYYI